MQFIVGTGTPAGFVASCWTGALYNNAHLLRHNKKAWPDS